MVSGMRMWKPPLTSDSWAWLSGAVLFMTGLFFAVFDDASSSSSP